MWPKDIGGFEVHRTRQRGDLGHVYTSRTSRNRRLIGEEDWAKRAQQEVADMALENHAKDLEKLKARRRTTEWKKRVANGPRDPWRATRHGPMREIILTANREWFEGREADAPRGTDAPETDIVDGVMTSPVDDLFGGDEIEGDRTPRSRTEHFEDLAKQWLFEHFGDDVVHARADLDETTYHVHAVILPRAVTKDGRRVLQPSKHAMIEDYEAAQDSVGAWFAQAGLVRGERRAEKIRDAIEHNARLRKDDPSGKDVRPVDVPKKRRHVSPRDWRRRQERKLAERECKLTSRETKVTQREQKAEEVLEIAAAVIKGDISMFEGTEEATAQGASKTGSTAPALSPARRLFGQALERLRGKAEAEAEDRLRREFALVEAARASLAALVRRLPQKTRESMSAVLDGLGPEFARLKTRLSRKGPGERDTEEKS
ncbi:hypothetical protein [Pseudooceanicola sp. LIPI14-2-Ac024]|uniref:hypothetical protein n=1 Tax=Pseudooceanicola sp. LIPI14-2-Ac024 TaxID=3344875 RepID=UPI0035D1163C